MNVTVQIRGVDRTFYTGFVGRPVIIDDLPHVELTDAEREQIELAASEKAETARIAVEFGDDLIARGDALTKRAAAFLGALGAVSFASLWIIGGPL